MLAAGLPAHGAVVCATPQQMKVLQSAALQQQLLTAAEYCQMTADYNAFVAAYRDRLAVADQSLQVFFARGQRGEDYAAYRSRLAGNALRRSRQDPRFCASAQIVFDIALGRGRARNGLAPEPPQLLETGYEGCRPVERAVQQAVALPRPTPRPELKTAAASSPRSPRVAGPANTAAVMKPAQIAVSMPHAAPGAALPAPRPLVSNHPVLPPTDGTAASAPRPKVVASLPSAKFVAVVPPPTMPVPMTSTVRDEAAAPELVSAEGQAAQRPRADDDPYADNHTPYAYRPGAEWVRDAGPASSAPAQNRRPPRYWVQMPDGRWVVVIGHQSQWTRD